MVSANLSVPTAYLYIRAVFEKRISLGKEVLFPLYSKTSDRKMHLKAQKVNFLQKVRLHFTINASV